MFEIGFFLDFNQDQLFLVHYSNQEDMKKTLLSLIFTLITSFAFAQAPVTISSGCETLGYHGTYTFYTQPNTTVSLYKKGIDCIDAPDESTCAGGPPPGFQIDFYSIQWEGTQWAIRHGTGSASLCEWFLGECTPKSTNGENYIGGELIATNPANTTQPPCNGWTFTNPPTCTPTITGDCTTLSANDFTFEKTIQIYPNPIENDFYIKSVFNSDLKVDILNSLGQVIISKEFTNSQEMRLSLNQPTGIYFTKITNKENQVAYFKLIKK